MILYFVCLLIMTVLGSAASQLLCRRLFVSVLGDTKYMDIKVSGLLGRIATYFSDVYLDYGLVIYSFTGEDYEE